MRLIDAIYKRHSVRSYLPDTVDQQTIHALLAAAVQAPTGLDLESWAFVVVQNRDVLKKLSEHAKECYLQEVHRIRLDQGRRTFEHIENPDFNIFYNASTLILICARSEDLLGGASCWLAAENLMLTACAMGLGTCVIGSSVAGLNSPEAKAELGIPDLYAVIVPILLGVPTSDGVPAPRKPPKILAWKE
jgi:nitroreductase